MSTPQPPQGQGPQGQPQGTEPQGYPAAPQAYSGPQGYPVPPAPQGYQPQAQPAQGYPGQGDAGQGYQAQGYDAQGYASQAPTQPYGAGPTGELVINLQKPFGAMGMITPMVTIDGYPATASWGRNAFPAPAGVRRVDVAQTYLWTYGRASMTVPVEAGRSAEVFYTGPMFTFGMGGRMGTEPQKRPGKGLFIGLMVFVFLLVFLAVLGGIAGSS